MDATLFIGRVSLALIFIWSGGLKILDPAGTEVAARQLGVPGRLTHIVARTLPVVELVLSVALLIPLTSVLSAALLALLLAAFTALLAGNIRKGIRPPCRCFGEVSNAPIGWHTVARNIALLFIALYLALFGSQAGRISSWAWFAEAPLIVQINLVLSIGILGALVFCFRLIIQLMAQRGRILERLDWLEGKEPQTNRGPLSSGHLGRKAAEFSVPGLDGGAIIFERSVPSSLATLLVFVDSECGPCRALLPDLTAWSRQNDGALQVLILFSGNFNESRKLAQANGISDAGFLEDRHLLDEFEIHRTPSAIIVDQTGIIVSDVASGGPEIQELLGGYLRSLVAEPRSEVAAKRSMPDLFLRSLSGENVNISEFLRTRTVLLFWNPACGFCRKMTDTLRTWETYATPSAPELVLVTSGDVRAFQEMNLKFRTLVDEDFSLGRAVGAGGTPSAVMVDEDGQLSSPIVAGESAVMGLLRT